MATLIDDAGQPHGLTVNSFSSVSASPPLVLICIDHGCSLLPLFRKAPHYGLSFLSESQQDLSNRFAVLPEGRFQGVDWRPGVTTGVPILGGAIGSMECTVRQVVEAGDHAIFIAEVAGCDTVDDAKPLLYYASGYRRMA